jgi:ABC-type Fe3+ transport system substrate-binding protein
VSIERNNAGLHRPQTGRCTAARFADLSFLSAQEIQAGKVSADVHMVNAPAFFDEAAKRGAFLKRDSGQWKDSEAFVKRAGQYSSYPFVVSPLGYAFQPVWNSGCPGMTNVMVDSYADVLSPDLKGKTIASDITRSFTYTNTAIALQRAGTLDLQDT